MLTDYLKALASDVRMEIIITLSDVRSGPVTSALLANTLKVSDSILSRHMKILEENDLVVRRRAGNHCLWYLNREVLKEVARTLESYTENQTEEDTYHETE